MRKTNFYGNLFGAVVIEDRRGTVSRVQTGAVYWFSDEERELTGAVLRFNPTGFTYTGAIAKQFAAELSDIRIAHFRDAASPDPRADYDAAIRKCRASLEELRQMGG